MKWSYTLILLTTVTVGCRNRATPLSNPFLAPDRVPPPAARPLTPGTAQPYYNTSQQVAPVVTPVGPGAYPPGAGIAPTSGFGSVSAIDPQSFIGSRVAGSGDSVSIPSDGQATRLEVRPAVAEITLPPSVRPVYTAEPSATPRSSIRTDQPTSRQSVGSTRTVQNNSGWLPPGHNRTPATTPVAAASRTSPRYFAAPPDETSTPVAPASYTPAQAYPTECYTQQSHPNQPVIIGPEMVVMNGGLCSPSFPSGGVQPVNIADLPPTVRRGNQTAQSTFKQGSSTRTASDDGFRARGSIQ